MLRSRVLAGLDRVRQQGKKLGRPRVSAKVEEAIRRHLNAGKGILKVAALVGVGSGTVQRVRREMVEQLVEVA
jgi:DNA invertase Pin-like site-specific DNA recombinase